MFSRDAAIDAAYAWVGLAAMMEASGEPSEDYSMFAAMVLAGVNQGYAYAAPTYAAPILDYVQGDDLDAGLQASFYHPQPKGGGSITDDELDRIVIPTLLLQLGGRYDEEFSENLRKKDSGTQLKLIQYLHKKYIADKDNKEFKRAPSLESMLSSLDTEGWFVSFEKAAEKSIGKQGVQLTPRQREKTLTAVIKELGKMEMALLLKLELDKKLVDFRKLLQGHERREKILSYLRNKYDSSEFPPDDELDAVILSIDENQIFSFSLQETAEKLKKQMNLKKLDIDDLKSALMLVLQEMEVAKEAPADGLRSEAKEHKEPQEPRERGARPETPTDPIRSPIPQAVQGRSSPDPGMSQQSDVRERLEDQKKHQERGVSLSAATPDPRSPSLSPEAQTDPTRSPTPQPVQGHSSPDPGLLQQSDVRERLEDQKEDQERRVSSRVASPHSRLLLLSSEAQADPTRSPRSPLPQSPISAQDHRFDNLRSIGDSEVNNKIRKTLFLVALENYLTNEQDLCREDLLDLFNEMRERNGSFGFIHKQENPSWDRFRLFFKKNRNGPEDENFWHTQTYQTAVKLLKEKYLALAPLENREDGEASDQADENAFIDYVRGNSAVHWSRTSTRARFSQ